MVRRDMFAMKRKFNGSFDTQCQEESVPISLKVLVNIVLNGLTSNHNQFPHQFISQLK